MYSDYNRVKELNDYNTKILYISTVISVISACIDKIGNNEKYPIISFLLSFMLIVNTILAIFYFYFEHRSAFIYRKAERTRMLQFIDNSFDTNFAGAKIQNYFNQDDINPGFYKLAVNCFENIIFTHHVLKGMQKGVYWKAIGVLVILIITFFIADKSIFRSIVELSFVSIAGLEAYKLSLFLARIDDLKHSFNDFFSSVRKSNFLNKEPEAIKLVISYESVLAWASFPLDSDLFDKINPAKSVEWEFIKKEFDIKNF